MVGRRKLLIGFVGLPGSGKSTALSAVADLAPVVIMGDIIREETAARGLEINGQNMGRVARELREVFGPMVVAERCRDRISALDSPVVFIDGIRSPEEVEYFRRYFDIYIIAVECEESLRYKRLMERHREDDTADSDYIKKRDERELRFGLGKVIESADIRIRNDGSVDDLKAAVRRAVNSLIEKFNIDASLISFDKNSGVDNVVDRSSRKDTVRSDRELR